MGEAEHKHQPCFTLFDPSGLKIEEGIIVKLPDSCTVAALYIIGIYLELRLGIHLRIVGKKDIVILLVSQRTLSIRAHKDTPVKSTCRHII